MQIYYLTAFNSDNNVHIK